MLKLRTETDASYPGLSWTSFSMRPLMRLAKFIHDLEVSLNDDQYPPYISMSAVMWMTMKKLRTCAHTFCSFIHECFEVIDLRTMSVVAISRLRITHTVCDRAYMNNIKLVVVVLESQRELCDDNGIILWRTELE